MVTRNVLKVILAGGFLSCSFLIAQNRDFDSFGRPLWLSTAKAQTSSSIDAVNRSTQVARANLFNSPPGQGHPLDDPEAFNNLQVTGGSHDFSQPDPFPTTYSDVVLIGKASAFQPFLSADHTRVYSELSLIPETILKDNSGLLKHNFVTTLLQEGGTIQLPSGKAAVSMPFGGSNPLRIDVRYLLFLRYMPEAKSYMAIRAWDISGDRPKELDNDGHPYQDRVRAELNDTNDEASLLSTVKARINQK